MYLDLEDAGFHTPGVRQAAPLAWVPVTRLLDTVSLLRWMRENAESLSDEHLATADRVAEAIREFQIPAYVVASAGEGPLLEIFTRMNTTGKPLTRTEVFSALHSGVAGDEPLDLHSLGRIPAEMGFGSLDDGLVLRCVLAFRGGDVFREYFAEEFESEAGREETFAGVAAALRDVIDFLRRDAGIPHSPVEAAPDVASTHLVDELGRQLLVGGDLGAFLARRGRAVESTIKHHVDRMAEWGARDGRSIAEAIRTVA